MIVIDTRPDEDRKMTRFSLHIAAVVLAFALGSMLAVAAPTEYDAKKVECTREAKAMRFGIHFIRRARFIKNCIAR
jgi:hypothetical protein